METAPPLVIADRVEVQMEIVDDHGNTLSTLDQFRARGESPFIHESWQYVAVPRGRGQKWALLVRDLDPPTVTRTRFGGSTEYTYSHNPVYVSIRVDGNSDEISTTLLHAHCPSDLIRGKKVDGQMYHFTFAVSDFRPNENAECESAVQNGGSISIRVNEYDSIVRTTTSFDAEPKRDSMFQRSPKQAPLVESSKTRHIKVSTLYEPPKAATGAAGAAINRKPRKWITRHGFLGEIGSGTLRYRDTDVLRARFSKRARIAEEDESSSAAEATQQGATTCDDDDDEVQEIEVIDLTIETVDLTQ